MPITTSNIVNVPAPTGADPVLLGLFVQQYMDNSTPPVLTTMVNISVQNYRVGVDGQPVVIGQRRQKRIADAETTAQSDALFAPILAGVNAAFAAYPVAGIRRVTINPVITTQATTLPDNSVRPIGSITARMMLDNTPTADIFIRAMTDATFAGLLTTVYAALAAYVTTNAL